MSVTDLKYFVKEQHPVVKTHFSVILANSITFDRSHFNFKLFPLKSIPKSNEKDSSPEQQVIRVPEDTISKNDIFSLMEDIWGC